MPYLTLGIFIGLFLGVVIEKFLFPYIDILFEVYTHKKTLQATDYQLSAKSLVCEFNRNYPELQENVEEQELMPAIGFQHSDQSEYDEDDSENKFNGFRVK